MIRVLFISHCSHLGGAEVALYRFLQQTKRFHPIVLLPKGEFSEALQSIGIDVILSRSLRKLEREKDFLWPIKFPVMFLGALFEILYYIRVTKVHILQCNNVYTFFYSLFPSKISKKPLILHMHDTLDSQSLFSLFLRFFRRFIHHTIAVSHAAKEGLLKYSGFHSKGITVVYNHVSPLPSSSLLLSDPEVKVHEMKKNCDFLIGTLGNLEEKKGVYKVVEALLIAKEKGKKVGLLIGGRITGPNSEKYRNKIQNLIIQKNLREQVFFLGEVKNTKRFFQYIDLFVHYPAAPDSLPTVILEAIQEGCPVVASNNYGNPECLGQGKWGVLIKANSPEVLANVLIEKKRITLSPEIKKEFEAFFSYRNKEKAHLKIYQNFLPEGSLF